MSEPSQTPAGAVRVQARQEMKRAILAAGRQRLASDGPERLSLRAVARDVGMVSSAVYRYVPSRDALLTELIIESYDSLGEAAEQAEASCPRQDVVGRWRAIGRGARTWAIAHPHEWALVFGSPIPGYAAPPDTVRAASRIPVLLVALLRDCAAAGVPLPDAALPSDVEAAMAPVREFFEGAVPAETALRGLMAWTYLVGSVSFQVFGQRTNVISPDGAAVFFDAELERIAVFVGFA